MILMKLLRGPAWVLFMPFYRVKIVGHQNIPKTGGFILAPNHVHWADPVVVVIKIKRYLRIMGKAEIFKNKFIGWFFLNAGVFPVDRGSGDEQALNGSVELLKNGEALLMFPEGTRSKTGELGRIKSGTAVIASSAGVPIVPVYIKYHVGRIKFFKKTIITVGEPIEAVMTTTKEEAIQSARQLTKQLKQQIIKLSEEHGE